MVYIITSKTRSKILRQPKERAKLMADRRHKTAEKHGVESVEPINGMSELEVHESMDEEGSGIKESMEMTREVNEQKRKAKRKAEESKRKQIIKERVEKFEKRDRDRGIPVGDKDKAKARAAEAKAKKRRKK